MTCPAEIGACAVIGGHPAGQSQGSFSVTFFLSSHGMENVCVFRKIVYKSNKSKSISATPISVKQRHGVVLSSLSKTEKTEEPSPCLLPRLFHVFNRAVNTAAVPFSSIIRTRLWTFSAGSGRSAHFLTGSAVPASTRGNQSRDPHTGNGSGRKVLTSRREEEYYSRRANRFSV